MYIKKNRYLHTYISMYVIIYICIYMYMYVYTSTRICMYIHMHIYIHIHMYMCMHVYVGALLDSPHTSNCIADVLAIAKTRPSELGERCQDAGDCHGHDILGRP